MKPRNARNLLVHIQNTDDDTQPPSYSLRNIPLGLQDMQIHLPLDQRRSLVESRHKGHRCSFIPVAAYLHNEEHLS